MHISSVSKINKPSVSIATTSNSYSKNQSKRPWDDPKERQQYEYSLTAMAKYLQQKVNEFSPDTQVGKDARADLAAVQSDLREMQLEDKSGNFNDGEKEATFQESYHDYWAAQKEFGNPPYSDNKISISRMVATRQLI